MKSIVQSDTANDFIGELGFTENVIVFEGDSLAAGYGVDHPPDYYVTEPDGFVKFSDGHPAMTLGWIYKNADTSINPKFAVGKTNIIVLWAGTNDLPTKTAQQIFDQLKSMCVHQRALGWKVFICTLPDITTATGAQNEVIRNAVNALIYASWSEFADQLVDLAGSPLIGPDGSYTNTTYFQADGVHLTNAGNEVVGAIHQAALDNYFLSLLSGEAGQVLTSNGSRKLPTWQTPVAGDGGDGTFPMPTTVDGVGKWRILGGSPTLPPTLPSDGRWAYFVYFTNSSGAVSNCVAGEAAGGTVVASGNYYFGGFCWRVS